MKEIIGLSKGIEFKIKKKDMLSLRKQIQHWGLSILIKSINNSEYPEMGCKVYPSTWKHRVTREKGIKSTKWTRRKSWRGKIAKFSFHTQKCGQIKSIEKNQNGRRLRNGNNIRRKRKQQREIKTDRRRLPIVFDNG